MAKLNRNPDISDVLWQRCVHFARRLGAADDAEDCVQIVFTRIWKAHDRLGSDCWADAYLRACIRNQVRNHQQWIQSRKERRLDKTKDVALTSSPEHAVNARIDIGMGMTKLSPRRREAYQAVRINGVSYSDAASGMGVTIKAVEKAVREADRTVRDYLTAAEDV